MKLKRLISTLIVFTLVMACAVSVSAASAGVTSVYTLDGELKVTATVTGATKDDMVSYVLCDDGTITDASSIKYIDQATVGEDGEVEFVVTDSVANLGATKVKFGTNGTAIAATNETIETITNGEEYLILDADLDVVNTDTENSKTYLFSVSPLLATNNLYANVTISKEGEDTLSLTDLLIASESNQTTLGLQLKANEDDDNAKYFDGSYSFDISFYYMDGDAQVNLVAQDDDATKTEGYYIPVISAE